MSGRHVMQTRSNLYNNVSNRTTISDIVKVPESLSSIVSDPKFQQTLLKIKEQSNINTIKVNRDAQNVAESIFLDASSTEATTLAKKLLEIHFKQQLKLIAAEEKLHRVETDLFLAQGEMASGHMVEFSIDPTLIGLIIGKKGVRIKQIQDETGVNNVYIEDSGKIKVIGNTASSVQKARELLEVIEIDYPLTQMQSDWYTREYQDESLNDIREVSDVHSLRFQRDTSSLKIIGVKSAVESAKVLLSTQMEYIQKQMSIKSDEVAAREKLYELKRQYGLPIRGGGEDSGGRGGRGRGGRSDARGGGRGGRGRGRQNNRHNDHHDDEDEDHDDAEATRGYKGVRPQGRPYSRQQQQHHSQQIDTKYTITLSGQSSDRNRSTHNTDHHDDDDDDDKADSRKPNRTASSHLKNKLLKPVAGGNSNSNSNITTATTTLVSTTNTAAAAAIHVEADDLMNKLKSLTVSSGGSGGMAAISGNTAKTGDTKKEEVEPLEKRNRRRQNHKNTKNSTTSTTTDVNENTTAATTTTAAEEEGHSSSNKDITSSNQRQVNRNGGSSSSGGSSSASRSKANGHDNSIEKKNDSLKMMTIREARSNK